MRKKILMSSLIIATLAASGCSSKSDVAKEAKVETTEHVVETTKEEVKKDDTKVETKEEVKEDESIEEDVKETSEDLLEIEDIDLDEFEEIPVTDLGRYSLDPIDVNNEQYKYTTEQGYTFATSRSVGYPEDQKENGKNTALDLEGIDADIVGHHHTAFDEHVDEAGGWFLPEEGCHSVYDVAVYEWSVPEYNNYLDIFGDGVVGDPQENVIEALEMWGSEIEVLPNSTIDKYIFDVNGREWTCYVGQGDLDMDPTEITVGLDILAWTKISDEKYVHVAIDYNVDPDIEDFYSTLTHKIKYDEALDETKKVLASFTVN